MIQERQLARYVLAVIALAGWQSNAAQQSQEFKDLILGKKVQNYTHPGKRYASPRPLIYVYDIPERYQPAETARHQGDGHSPYVLDIMLAYVIEQSPYHTTNPEDADYFLIPAWLYWKRWEGNLEELRADLRKMGPWLDRRHGHDHILVSTYDDGRGWYAGPSLFNMTQLMHYGSMAGEEIQLLHTCNTRTRWGAECDWQMTIGMNALHKQRFSPNYIPGLDMVVPSPGFEIKPHTSPYINKAHAMDMVNKTSILFYAGEIDIHEKENRTKEPWSDAYYSMGGRQTTFHVVGNLSHYAIHTKHAHNQGSSSFDYFTAQRRSIFCLAPAGWGWGMRMKIAIVHGCIPVIVQDGIRVEWEEHLPIRDYAIRVPMHMMHKLDDILKLYIRTGRVQRMQKVLECAWRLHWWRRPHGRAFEVFMCELKRRMLGIKSGRMRVDWDRCVLYCGDDKEVKLNVPNLWHNV